MKNVISILILLVFASCSSSHDVVHSGLWQKRKYKKGYNLSFKKKVKKEKGESSQDETVQQVKEKKFVLDSVVYEPIIEVEEKEEQFIVSSNDDYQLKVYSVLEKIEQKTPLKVLNTEKQKEQLNKLIEKSKKSKSGSSYTWLLILGILSSVFIFGIFILIKLNKIKKEDLGLSNKINFKAKITTAIYLTGLVMLAYIVYLLSIPQNDADVFGLTAQFYSAALIGVFGIGVLILGVFSLISLFKELNKLGKIEGMSEDEQQSYREGLKNEIEDKKLDKEEEKSIKEKEKRIKEEQKKEAIAAGLSNNDSVKLRLWANICTWMTSILPLFIVPAIILNVIVLKKEKENKSIRKKAVLRLVSLIFLFLIGLVVGITIFLG